MNKIERLEELSRKLLVHAESAKKIGSLHEAQAFAAKAAKMADKYGFDLPKVLDKTLMETFNWEAIKYYQKQYACALARLYGSVGIICSSKRAHGSTAYVKVHGTKNQIDMAIFMFEANNDLIEKLMKVALKEHRAARTKRDKDMQAAGWGPSYIKAWLKRYFAHDERFRRDFYVGVGTQITQGVAVMREAEDRINGATESTNAIISTAVGSCLEDYHSKVGPTSLSSTKKRSTSAFNAGMAAGKNASAGKQLKG
tara:strand:+ start:564 stop:1328 length:765 start_codon:yes stop_codon:yes gene_type:complete